jgi:hypothetical protein
MGSTVKRVEEMENTYSNMITKNSKWKKNK